MTATLPLPLEPTGRTWTGASASFKQAALGGTSISVESDGSVGSFIYSGACGNANSNQTLGPGQTIETQLVWQASLAQGVPALLGNVPFTLTLMGYPGYPEVLPTQAPGLGIGADFVLPEASNLHVSGQVEVAGPAPKLLSKGQVIDAALSDPQFAKWLAEEPSSTWSIINIVLENEGPTAYIPAGPNWMIEVVRENGVPRNLALAFVDPYTGAVQMNTCESPCSR